MFVHALGGLVESLHSITCKRKNGQETWFQEEMEHELPMNCLDLHCGIID